MDLALRCLVTEEVNDPLVCKVGISREELSDLVWSQPMIHVARLLGRSDVAVGKACRRRNIQVPPQGYWAKLAAGKPVQPRPPLLPM
jgi:hypothetical protein